MYNMYEYGCGRVLSLVRDFTAKDDVRTWVLLTYRDTTTRHLILNETAYGRTSQFAIVSYVSTAYYVRLSDDGKTRRS